MNNIITDLDIENDELIDVLIKRANKLRKQNFYLLVETSYAIKQVQDVLDEYSARYEDFNKVFNEKNAS